MLERYRRLGDPSRAQLQFWALIALGVAVYLMQDAFEPVARVLAFALLLLVGVFFVKRGRALAEANGRIHGAVLGAGAGRRSERLSVGLFRFLGVAILVLLPVGVLLALIDAWT